MIAWGQKLTMPSLVVKGLIRDLNSSRLMAFMRTVGTGKVRLCQIETYHTDLAVTSLCVAVNGTHDPQIIYLKAKSSSTFW